MCLILTVLYRRFINPYKVHRLNVGINDLTDLETIIFEQGVLNKEYEHSIYTSNIFCPLHTVLKRFKYIQLYY